MTEQVISGFVDVNGGQLYYEVAGAGHPLVLIHAGIADCRMWDEQFAEFAQHYRVIRYDTRGFGRSRTTGVTFSNRQDLADLLYHLGVTQTYLLGCSRGGEIAIDFTLEHPELVTALVAVAAGLSGYAYELHEATIHETELIAELESAWEQGDTERLNELELRMFVDGPDQPTDRVPAALRERVLAMNAGNLNRQEEQATPQPLDPPAVDRLAEIKIPTLVIIGDLDTSATQAIAKHLAEGIAGVQQVVLNGVAHLPNMEQPAVFSRIVLDFLHNRTTPIT